MQVFESTEANSPGGARRRAMWRGPRLHRLRRPAAHRQRRDEGGRASPPELGLRTGTRWCDCANLHGAGPIAGMLVGMLAQLTGRHQDQLHDRVVRSLGYFSGIFGAQSLLNGIVNGREVARHVTAVLPGVASKNIMSDM